IKLIQSLGIDCEVLYLQAEHGILLRRYSETRRKHPLTSPSVPLEEAIELEHQILEPVFKHADLVIDTTRTNFHQLRELVRARVCEGGQTLSVLFQSFGFKHGIPLDVDFVFDARCLPNPHWEPALRGLTGNDPAVAEFLGGMVDVRDYFNDMSHFLRRWVAKFEAENRSYLTVSVGCTGGRHRSVYLVECLSEEFNTGQWNILVRHRELD
ncbi:MAG: RNase adapter RapZ, partial [Pseudomonadota bacterium]